MMDRADKGRELITDQPRIQRQKNRRKLDDFLRAGKALVVTSRLEIQNYRVRKYQPNPHFRGYLAPVVKRINPKLKQRS